MMKYLIGGVLLAAIALAAWSYFPGKDQPSLGSSQSSSNNALAPEVESVLTEKAATLATLSQDFAILEAVRTSSRESATLSMNEIQRLDGEWQAATTITPFIAKFMSNAAAQRLIEFQRAHPEFKEIFITDVRGLNVSQTDKTSDYYQADESWWVESFNAGKGAIMHGDIEFDESSQTEAISIYVPIMGGVAAIGVMKAVADLSEISKEL